MRIWLTCAPPAEGQPCPEHPLLQWGHGGDTAWGGWVTTGSSRCHLTHRQQSPCKDSVQSITSNICFPILPRRRLLIQTLLSRTSFYISCWHRCWWLWRLGAAKPAPLPTWQPRRKATGMQAAGLPLHPAPLRGRASTGRGCAQPRHQPPVLSGCFQQCWVLGWLRARNKGQGINRSV